MSTSSTDLAAGGGHNYYLLLLPGDQGRCRPAQGPTKGPPLPPLLRIWEKLGGRSSLTAWQQRSDIGCQASRITCAAPAEHLTPATGARLQCPRVQDNCNNRLLLCRGAMRSCCRVRRTHGLRWSAAQPALLYLAHTSPPTTGTCSACLCQHTNPLWWTCQPVCVPQVHNPLHPPVERSANWPSRKPCLVPGRPLFK